MLERKIHWAGSSTTWIAEWIEAARVEVAPGYLVARMIILEYGPFSHKEAHKYMVGQVMEGKRVALADNEYEKPILELAANLGRELTLRHGKGSVIHVRPSREVGKAEVGGQVAIL